MSSHRTDLYRLRTRNACSSGVLNRFIFEESVRASSTVRLSSRLRRFENSCSLSGSNKNPFSGEMMSGIPPRVSSSFTTQCISYHIRFTWVIFKIKIILIQILHPSPLAHIQIPLSKDIFERFMIRKHLKLLSIKVMPPTLQGKYHSAKLQIVRKIILFMCL